MSRFDMHLLSCELCHVFLSYLYGKLVMYRWMDGPASYKNMLG